MPMHDYHMFWIRFINNALYSWCHAVKNVTQYCVGEAIPTMPVFIEIGASITLPIEETSIAAYEYELAMHHEILE